MPEKVNSSEAAESARVPSVTKGPFSRLLGAAKAIQRELAFQLSQHGVAKSHYFYLRALLEKDGITITEISERVGIEPATVTAMVDRLTSIGLVERRRHASDRRKIRVFLTEKGALLREPLLAAIQTSRDVTMAGVSVADREVFFKTLDTIVGNVDKHLSDDKITPLRPGSP